MSVPLLLNEEIARLHSSIDEYYERIDALYDRIRELRDACPHSNITVTLPADRTWASVTCDECGATETVPV